MMRKRLVMTAAAVLMAAMFILTGCGQEHCKYPGCTETDIYEDGYCKYHYYKEAGDNTLKHIINGDSDETEEASDESGSIMDLFR